MEASDMVVVRLNSGALILRCGASLGFPGLLGPLGMSRASEQHFLVHFGESDGIFGSSPQINTTQTQPDTK